MPQLSINATELVETNVDFISIVERGANRIPFRLMKEQTEDGKMLDFDLSKLGNLLFKTEAAKPAIAAVVVAKTADLAAVTARITKAGLDYDSMTENDDGTRVFAQKGVVVKDQILLKVSDEIGLVISHAKKSFSGYDFSSTEFKDVMQIEGFYPSVYMAMSMLETVIGNSMNTADSVSEAQTAIAKAAEDFSHYVKMLVSILPERAFKMDGPVTTATLAGQAPTTAEAVADPLAPSLSGVAPAPVVEPATKDEAADTVVVVADPVITNPIVVAEVDPAPEPEKVVEVVKSPDFSLIIAKVLEGPLAALNESIGSIAKGLADQSARLDGLETSTQKHDKALNSTVVMDAPEDRAPVVARKSAGAPPLMDTAVQKIDFSKY